MSTAELKPCPFCGSCADMQNQFMREFWAQCTNLDDCGAADARIFPTPREAADAWNHRSSTTPAQAPAQAAEPVADAGLDPWSGPLLAAWDVVRAYTARFYVGGRGLVGPIDAEVDALDRALDAVIESRHDGPVVRPAVLQRGRWVPLVAAPHPSEPAATGRVPLTDEQITHGALTDGIAVFTTLASAYKGGVRFAERAHGIAPTGSAAPTGEAE
jgi:hypothetical protein